VLFVCEDNGFAATTRTKTMTAGDGPSTRARSLGLIAEEIDGNDVLAGDLAARELVRAIRDGGGPRFLHLHTYRLTGHTGADPAAYRPKEEVEKRWLDDPIARAAALLEGAGVKGDALTAERNEAFREMREAYDVAKATPYPSVEQAFADVQDVGDPRVEAF
jgi:acetoin:2,6-dichlorophenolindophenol oxidoreductase subunit alpha